MAGSVFVDVCRFLPTAGGTTDWTFSSAVTGYQSPALSGIVNGSLYSYRAESADLSQWEITQGAYNTGTGVAARTTVLYNSSGTGTGAGQSGAGTKINFSTIPQVAIVALREDLLTANITKSIQQTGTDNVAGVTALHQQDHDSAAKAWGYVTYSGATPTLAAGYNIASIAAGGTGVLTVNFTVSFASVNYVGVADAVSGSSLLNNSTQPSPTTASQMTIQHREGAAGAVADPDRLSFVVYGRQ